jgi:predicted alpha/beta-fold hydrolase
LSSAERSAPVGTDFAPPRWLAHPHLQSVIAGSALRRAWVARRAAPLRAASRELLLECGDGVRLQAFHAAQPRGGRDLALLLHGWEGSVESQYLLSAASYLYERGFDVLRLNFRDHGDTHHLNSELFHSCRIAEVVGAVAAVQRLFPEQRLSLAGYSLGGNFALRVAVRAPAAGIRLTQVVAICPVLDPVHTLEALETGLWIYRHYFVTKWRRSLRRKHAAWPDRYQLAQLLESRNLTRMTELLVIRHSEFPDLLTYLNGYAIVGNALAGLAVPSRIIASRDDPVIPARDLARLARSPSLELTVQAAGGHCGFLETLGGPTWADRQVFATLAAAHGRAEPRG